MSAVETPAARRRDDRGPRRWILSAGATAVAIFVAAVAAWQIVAVAQARSLTRESPEVALAWRPNDPRALGYLAEREFSDAAVSGRPPDAARSYARQALNAGPLEVRALRVLAWVADEEGDDERARWMMALAASRSPRDVSSHLWMFHDRLKARDFPAAFAHGDALMRHPATRREAAVLMASAAGADEAAAKALERRLILGPAWRGLFVSELAASQDPDVTLSILLAVKEAGSSIAAEESGALAVRLLREKRPREAYLAWVLLLPPAGYDLLGNVYDGGFEAPSDGGPFGWTLHRNAADIASGSGRKGPALSARDTGEGQRGLARQFIVLAPGSYRLSMAARLDGASGGGMTWTVSCVGSPTAELARLPVGLSPDWKSLSTTFQVSDDCEAQSLELQAGNRGGPPVWGWFDDIRIEAVGAEG